MDELNQLAYEKARDIFNERTNRFLGGGWSSRVLMDEVVTGNISEGSAFSTCYINFTLMFFDGKNERVYKIKHVDQIDILANVYIVKTDTEFNDFINSIWMDLFENVIKHIEETDPLPHYDSDESVTLYH